MGSKGSEVVRALACEQCDPGSNPSVDDMSLSLLLALYFAAIFFLQVLWISRLFNQHFQIPIRQGMLDKEPLCG